MRGEHLFELAVGAEFGRDQAGDAVGQPVRGAHLGDLVPQRLLEERKQRRDLAGRLGRRVRPLDERDRLDVGGALAHRLERLAVESRRRRHPEGVDRVCQQQHFDAARLEPFELRARGEALGVIAGQVKDRRLVLAQRGDILGQRPVGRRMGGGYEAGDLEQAVAALGVLVQAFLDHRAEMLPHLGELVRLGLGELAELLHYAVGDALADRREHVALLDHLARDVERQVGAVDHEADEPEPAGQEVGVLGDEHAAHIKLVAPLPRRIEQVERPRAGNEGEHGIFMPPFGAPMQRQRRLVELAREAAVELGIFLRRHVGLGLGPDRCAVADAALLGPEFLDQVDRHGDRARVLAHDALEPARLGELMRFVVEVKDDARTAFRRGFERERRNGE